MKCCAHKMACRRFSPIDSRSHESFVRFLHFYMRFKWQIYRFASKLNEQWNKAKKKTNSNNNNNGMAWNIAVRRGMKIT